MIAILINLAVLLLVLVVAFYILRLVVTHFGAPAIIVQVVGLIFALIFVLYALKLVGVAGPAWRY